MKYIKEVTKWAYPNHTYMVSNRGWLEGYIKEGTTEEIWFTQPIKAWSETGRKFVKLKEL